MLSEPFTYDKNKVIQALRYHFITRVEIKFMIIFINVFAIACAILFYTNIIHPIPFIVSSLLWFILMIIFWFVMPFSIYKKEKTFRDEFRASFTEEGFGIENERASRSWAWPQFSSFLESPHFFHLYFNARSFFLVPKEARPGDEVHDVRNLLKEHITKN